MITYLDKDITTVEEGIVAHGVNCMGAMGSGVAKAIREKWPDAYSEYMKNGRYFNGKDESLLGSCQMVPVDAKSANCRLFVANCYTQKYYGHEPGRKYAEQRAINESLGHAYSLADVHDLDIYMPKIGAGLGGLNWTTEVLPIVEMWDKLSKANTYICVWG